MQRDIRSTDEFQEVAAFYQAAFEAGANHVYAARELEADPEQRMLYLTGLSFRGALEEGPTSGIYRLPLDGRGGLAPVADGRLPKPSPAGRHLAYVAPLAEGDRLVVADLAGGPALPVPSLDGHIEALQWSPDGRHLLLVVAGIGADLSGHEGGFSTALAAKEGPAWLPEIETGQEECLWRRLWVWEAASGAARIVSAPGTNVWEAAWCGNDRIAIIRSTDHSEGAWYRAALALVELNGAERVIYRPDDQIGLPAGAPDGSRIAFVEAFCSDRGVVCGTLKLAALDGTVLTVDTQGVEVTGLTWRDSECLHYAGHRAFETVAGDYHRAADHVTELWCTEQLTAGEWYPASLPLGEAACVVVAEAYGVPPRIDRIGPDGTVTLHDCASPGAVRLASSCGEIGPVRWQAPDGLEIHGWLVRPIGVEAPYPLMIDIHGGPVWANRNRWMGRLRATALLARRGYAVLYPNPRGSSTRGQDYARRVEGDMGGADTLDFLTACDALVERGLVDGRRIALTGTSYGGFMSAWLTTQDARFAAAVPISPVSDWYSQHRTSQIPFFDEMFLEASAAEPDNRFFHRSPAMFADRVKTPVLVMAGARDKNTPPGQALEFYSSVREHGGKAVLVIYPEDGHSLRGHPAFFDTAARILQWLAQHLGV